MKKQMIRGNIILSIALACILCVVNVYNDQNIITANSNRFNEGDTTITTETNLVNDDKKDSGIVVEEGVLEGDDTVDGNKDKDKNKDNTDKKETDKDSDKEGCTTNCTTTTETTTKDTKTTNREYDVTIKKPKKEEAPEKKEKKEEPKKILPKAGEGKLPLLEIVAITTVLGIIYVSSVKSMQKRLQI